MKRILLDENSGKAFNEIANIKNQARQYMAMVNEYNKIEALKSLDNEEDIINFIYNPEAYFENAVLEQLGNNLTVVNGVKPSARALSNLYNIDYEGVKRKFITRCYDFSGLCYDKADNTIDITVNFANQIKEDFKLFATEEETEMVLFFRDLAKKLNIAFEFMGVLNTERPNIVNQIGLVWKGNNNFDINISKARQILQLKPFNPE